MDELVEDQYVSDGRGKPTPTGGPWTTQYVLTLAQIGTKAIIDAHNAALAAERERHKFYLGHVKLELEQLREQLDLEKRQCAFESEQREKYRTELAAAQAGKGKGG